MLLPAVLRLRPGAGAARLRLGDVRLLVTTRGALPAQGRGIRGRLPGLEHVLLVGPDSGPTLPGTALLRRRCSPVPRTPSRSRPPARGHGAAPLHQRHHRHPQGRGPRPRGAWWPTTPPPRFALDLHPDDVFWCTADPGWVTGTSYGIIAPLTHGVTDAWSTRASSTPAAGTGILADATGQRLVHRADRHPDADARHTAQALRTTCHGPTTCRRCASSPASANRSTRRRCCGARRSSGLPIHDNWWQTETGGIMIANFAALDIRPGSMGRPLPGRRGDRPANEDEDGRAQVIDGRGQRAGQPGGRGRAGAAPGLAVDVPRLPRTTRSATRRASPTAGT